MNPAHQNITAFALRKMAEWGLTEKGWIFTWNTRRASFGLCRVKRKRGEAKAFHKSIELSSFLFPTLTQEEQEDIVLHEIAHGLDFEQRGRSGHDRTWRLLAIKVGAKPERCKNEEEGDARAGVKCKYTLRCPKGHEFMRHRFTRRNASCPTCNPHFYDERFKLELIQNY